MTKNRSEPARLWWSGLHLTLLLLFVGCPAAFAADPIPAEELTRLLVEGKGPADWGGVLEGQLLAEPRDSHEQRYAEVVGRLFWEPELTADMPEEQRRKLFAFVIDHLIEEEPESDVILLVDVFLPHLEADRELVKLLRKGDLLLKDLRTGRRLAWDRLQRSVEGLLSAPDPKVRRAAIRLVPERDESEIADAVAALYGALQAAGGNLEREDAAAYFDAFEALLHHRFANVASLTDFLGDFQRQLSEREKWSELDRVAVERDLLRAVLKLTKREGSRYTERWLQAARKYGRLLIEKAQSPGDLASFFDPDLEGDPILQREAAQKATTLKPVADEGWAEFLRGCLAHSTDDQVLLRAIDILGSTFVERSLPHAPLVASAVARRLKEHAKTDSVDPRVDLAGILGAIGSLTDLQEVLPDPLRLGNGNGPTPQAPVWSALIHAVGHVDSGLVMQLAVYYRYDGKLQPDWARLAVAEALGHPGIRGSGTQRPLAAALLRHILTGAAIQLGEQDLPVQNPEAVAKVRIAAIRSLQHYPGPGTAEVLGELVVKEGDEGAEAMKFLGRQLGEGSVDAANVIAELLANESDGAHLDALLVLVSKEAPATLDPGTRSELARAVRGVLTKEGAAEAVQSKAAQAAVHLADPLAMGAVYELWKAQTAEAARARWKRLLQALLVAVAPAGQDDPSVDTALREHLRKMGDDQHHAEALEFMKAMGENAARVELKRLRAGLHLEYASVSDGRTPAEQRADLDAAGRLFREVARDTKVELTRQDSLKSAYEALKDRGRAPYLDVAGGEQDKTFQLEALEVAVQIGEKATAQEALDSIVRALEEGDVRLTEQEKASLAKYKSDLTAIANK